MGQLLCLAQVLTSAGVSIVTDTSLSRGGLPLFPPFCKVKPQLPVLSLVCTSSCCRPALLLSHCRTLGWALSSQDLGILLPKYQPLAPGPKLYPAEKRCPSFSQTLERALGQWGPEDSQEVTSTGESPQKEPAGCHSHKEWHRGEMHQQGDTGRPQTSLR